MTRLPPEAKAERVRVKESLTRFVEGKLKLVVNRTKTKSAPLRKCSFLGFRVGVRGLLVWTDKTLLRFKQRVKDVAERRWSAGRRPEGWRSHQITSRSRGRSVKDVILELRRYVTGWLNYFGIARGYKDVAVLDSWIRRRVRMYYWKQPRARRRHLIALGIPPEETKLETRSRKGYWRIRENSILHRALNNQWLEFRGAKRRQDRSRCEPEQQGVPDFRKQWIVSHYRPKTPCLVGTARCGLACRVVWDLWLIDSIVSQSRGPNYAIKSGRALAFPLFTSFS